MTGISGFIGGHVKKSLIEDNFEVIEFNGDITKVKDWVKNLTTLPEVIIHCAGVRTESKKDFAVNVGGVKALFSALTQVSQKPAILIFISTQAVYFGLQPPFTEKMIPKPTTFYGKSKLQAEEIISKMGSKFGIRTVILRLSTVLGPGVREQSKMSGPLFAWTQKAIENKPLVVFQDGKQTRDYIVVSDVVSAIVLTLKNNKMEGIFNVGGGRKIQLVQLARLIKQAAKSHSQIVIKGGQPTVNDPRVMFTDTTRIRKFGWRPAKWIKTAIENIFSTQSDGT